MSLTDMFHKYNVIKDLSNQYIFSKEYLYKSIYKLFNHLIVLYINPFLLIQDNIHRCTY